MNRSRRGLSDQRVTLKLAVQRAMLDDARYALVELHAKPVDVLDALLVARDVLARELNGQKGVKPKPVIVHAAKPVVTQATPKAAANLLRNP